jgi:mono/diheme cytochrome c family protein
MRSLIIAVAVVLSAAVVAGRQASTAAVFTAEQAAAGKEAFAKSCASCHMPDLSGNECAPPLAGPNFLSTWHTRTTKDLLDYMATTMPAGGATLPKETYVSITAFVLQTNGAVAGTNSLNATIAVPIGTVTSHKHE